MEEELPKTDRGKDKLERAKDRIDEKDAQMGSKLCKNSGRLPQKPLKLVMAHRSPGRMPATLLTMAGEPKLLGNRR